MQRMMRELWVEYVIGNPKLLKLPSGGVPIPDQLDSIGRSLVQPVARYARF